MAGLRPGSGNISPNLKDYPKVFQGMVEQMTLFPLMSLVGRSSFGLFETLLWLCFAL